MRRRAIIAVVIFSVLMATPALVGCTGGKTDTSTGDTGTPPLSTTDGSSGQEEAAAYSAKEFVDVVSPKALSWASDARPYKMESGRAGEDPTIADGTSALWRVWFASASKKEMSIFYVRDGQPAMYPEGGGGGFTYETPGFFNLLKVDSTDAVRIARDSGMTEVKNMRLYDTRAEFVTRAREVPESCAVYWDVYGVGSDGLDVHVYIDASSGSVYK